MKYYFICNLSNIGSEIIYCDFEKINLYDLLIFNI